MFYPVCPHCNKPVIQMTRYASVSDVISIVTAVVSFISRVAIEDIKSTRRFQPMVDARQTCWKLIREVNKEASLKMIGNAFGRNHTTIMSGLLVIEDKIDTEEKCRNIYEEARAILLPEDTEEPPSLHQPTISIDLTWPLKA